MKGLDAILISVQLKKCWKKGQRKDSEFSWGFWVLIGTQKFYFVSRSLEDEKNISHYFFTEL